MKRVIVILLILTTLAAAEGFKRHAFTLSTGIRVLRRIVLFITDLTGTAD